MTLARRIIERLRGADHAAYLVGGCVRDLLLGRAPKDYDVATAATLDAVLRLFPAARLVGAQFGVVLVRDGDDQVEVATFRSEAGYADGRHPDAVRFETAPAADARRRDFTINGLFLDPLTDEVLDFVGGQEDLRAGVLRAIGDPRVRFQEDHLRLLRAVRFAARLGFAIEPDTLAAVRELALLVGRVAAERVRDELTRILTEGHARRGFELLDASGLLPEVLPEVAAMQGCPQNPDWHPEGDVWAHTLLMLAALEAGVPATLAWGVLLHDVGKPPCTMRDAEGRIRHFGHEEIGARMAEVILTRLRFSTDELKQVVALVANHMRFKDVPKMKESTLKRFMRMDRFGEHLELHRIDCSSSHGRLDIHDSLRQRLTATPPADLRPPRLLTGEDLKRAGYPPSPTFAAILRDVEDAQLDGTLQSNEAALDYVRTRYPVP